VVTTDLLFAWTDPDTAMEAVGTRLGIFSSRTADPRAALSTDSPLRKPLLDLLLSLVDSGVLEKRPCADGRFAFRWRDDVAVAAVAVDEEQAQRERDRELGRRAVPVQPRAAPAPPARDDITITEPTRDWARLVAPTAPLVFPAVSCILVILAFVWFDHVVALVVVLALALIGVVGLARRIPFAGFWTLGLVVAGLLLHFS
jgi:hypothetical protein